MNKLSLFFIFSFSLIASSCNPTANFKSDSLLGDIISSDNTSVSSTVQIPQPYMAFSLRKLNSSYTGPCIRVRRSSDNAEQDIAFDGNELDITTLLAFVGGSNGFVRTWYDQSPNSNHAAQPNTSLQPMIVSTGSLITKNTIASVLFNLSSMTTINSFSLNDWTMFVIFSDNSSSTQYERIIDHSYTQGLWFGRENTFGNFGGGVKESSVPYGRFVSVTSSQLTLIANQRVATTHSIWLNNNYPSRNSGAVTATATQSNPLGIGSWVNNTVPAQRATDMNISEIIIYNSDQTSKLDDIESSIGSYYSIF
ncbi:MAG: hypothetical protein N4A33_04770 [Bacteriovoracaceae bacterium]|jgi:hypothetical protein|nr:hypothetical protein [Bacteriovoracaceae bacterium]